MKKKDISNKLNAKLETSIDFTRLKINDLNKLLKAVETKVSGSVLGSLGQSVLNKPLAEVLKHRAGKRPLGEMTLNDVFGAVGESVGDKGPLGLGLLPRILGKFEKGG